MNKFEHYLVDLLQHHITYDDKEVQVRRQFQERGEAPCITLDTGAISTEKYFRETLGGDSVIIRRNCDLYINLWCNTEEERESISEQIMQCFLMEQSGHYTYCSRYNSGRCTTNGKRCAVHTIDDGRTAKNLCPSPEEYHYESLESKHMIIQGSMNINPPVMMDERDQRPPLLRNRFDCEATYYDMYTIGGDAVENINIVNIDTIKEW